jgi:hypothetical protein
VWMGVGTWCGMTSRFLLLTESKPEKEFTIPSSNMNNRLKEFEDGIRALAEEFHPMTTEGEYVEYRTRCRAFAERFFGFKTSENTPTNLWQTRWESAP